MLVVLVVDPSCPGRLADHSGPLETCDPTRFPERKVTRNNYSTHGTIGMYPPRVEVGSESTSEVSPVCSVRGRGLPIDSWFTLPQDSFSMP